MLSKDEVQGTGGNKGDTPSSGVKVSTTREVSFKII